MKDSVMKVQSRATKIHAELVQDHGVDPVEADSRCAPLDQWCRYIEEWRTPLDQSDVQRILDASVFFSRRRHRGNVNLVAAMGRNSWLSEATEVGDSIYERVQGGSGWGRTVRDRLIPGQPQQRRLALLDRVRLDLDREMNDGVESTAPTIGLLPPCKTGNGSYPGPQQFPAKPVNGDWSAWDSKRQISIHPRLLASNDCWDAIATVVHEHAHDTQWCRENERHGPVPDVRKGDINDFAKNQLNYQSGRTIGQQKYASQALEDDAFRREAIALLQWSLRRTGHPAYAMGALKHWQFIEALTRLRNPSRMSKLKRFYRRRLKRLP